MNKVSFLLFLIFGFQLSPMILRAEGGNAEQLSGTSNTSAAEEVQADPLSPFTGKITRNKVRMRLQPNLDAPILCELNRDDLLSVVGESEEFYSILPPKSTKAYIFRTFVLDNVVEGSRVNVRMEPALESPVIAQLNSGDQVDGEISALNSKWLEIKPPATTRFYVCKEYVEKIGSPEMLILLEKRRTEVSALLSAANAIADTELQKNFQEIRLDDAIANLNTILKQYSDFPKSIDRAKALLSSIQDAYLQKKIAFLEAKAWAAESTNKAQATLSDAITEVEEPKKVTTFVATAEQTVEESYSEPLFPLEEVEVKKPKRSPDWNTPFDPTTMSEKMSYWLPTEQALYEKWSVDQEDPSPKDFYENQFADSIARKGIIEPYGRAIRSKPGDYLLVSPTTRLPIAYLYSTRVDLQEHVGQEVSIHAIARPNNNFAFPAYYVISLE